MSHLHFDLHGLSVSIQAQDPDLSDFVKAHFDAGRGASADADLSIKATWRWGGREPAGPSGRNGARIERLGRGLTLSRGTGQREDLLTALWTKVPDFPELTLGFELDGDTTLRLSVDARCVYEPKGVGRKLGYLRQERVDRKRNRLFFKLMYFMIYYPMAWQFERTRGWGLLHASAVTLPSGHAVLLSGMGGVGKSTLGLSLLSHPGAKLLSDNLIFHDEDRIYSCPEPVRLDAASVAGMTEAGLEPERTKLPSTAHPKPTYGVSAGRRAAAAPPGAVFFLRFAPRSGVTPIDADRAASMLIAGNDLAREIKDYRPTSALLSILAAERGRPEPVTRSRLERLLRSTPCAIFRIGEGEKIAQTTARLAEAAGGTGR